MFRRHNQLLVIKAREKIASALDVIVHIKGVKKEVTNVSKPFMHLFTDFRKTTC